VEFIEELFGSKGRTRVLSVLTENGELSITHIARSAGMNYSAVNGHLEKLKEHGLILEKRFGPIRIFDTTFDRFIVRFEKDEGVTLESDAYEDRTEAFP